MTNATNAAQAAANPAQGGAASPDLGEVFRSLQKQRRTGTLKVSAPGNRVKYIYFNAGEIELVKAPRAKTLIGRALVKRRKVSEQDLEKALRRHRQSGEKLGKCCVALALVRDEDIREALAFQAIEEIADLFTWREPKSEFHRGEPPLDIFDFDDLSSRLRLSPEALVKEASRRAQELEAVRAKIPSMADVYAPSPEAYYDMKPAADGTPERDLLQVLDGERDLDEVLEAVRLSDLEALRTLDRLVKSGEVVALTPNQLFTVGAECEKDGRLEKARKLYLRAEAAGLDQLDLPNRVAKIADALGYREEAVGRYLEFAERCKQEELPDAAVAAFRKALEIEPGSLPAQEGIVSELVALGKGGEAVATLKQLVTRYDPATERDKIHRAWLEVLRLLPEDPDAHRAMAHSYLEEGDKVQAIIEMEELAAIHISRAEFDDAIRVLREILTIDAECVEAHLQLATTLAQTGHTEDAVTEYGRLADSLSKAGVGGESTNWQFLIDIYEKIVSLAPANKRARQWLAEAYREKADADRAVGHYKGLVDALKAQGGEATEDLAEALRQYAKLCPDDFPIREELGQLLARLGKREEAAAVLRDARDGALRAHRFDIARRACEAALTLAPLDLDALKALVRVAALEKDEERVFEKSRDLAEIAFAAGLFEDAIEAARKALELSKDSDLRRKLALALESKGQPVDAAKELAEVARADFADEDYGRARKAAERAVKLDPTLQAARDMLYMLDTRRHAVSQAASQSRPPAAEKPPMKPTITGGSPDVTIIDRPRKKYGSVTGVADKLKAMMGGPGGAEGTEEAAPEAPVEEAPKTKALGAIARLKALKSGGLFKTENLTVVPAQPAAEGPEEAAAEEDEAPAASPAPAAEATEPPPPVAAPAPEPPPAPAAAASREPQWTPAGDAAKKVSAAAKLKQLKGGGASAGDGVPAAPAGGEAHADAAAARIREAEQGQMQAGAAKKALSAAAKLKNLGR